jgi:D-sedoheptulose 7-phosphate isomerase
MDPYSILDKLIKRYPILSSSQKEISGAFNLLRDSYDKNGKLLICGNGGSASDAEHIVGELMKSFSKERKLSEEVRNNLIAVSSEKGEYLADHLQPGLPAIALTCHSALITAFSNDVDPDLVFAQQVLGYGTPGDVLMGISTSGNAKNVLNALLTAKALGISTIGLSGKTGGKFNDVCDIVIHVDATIIPEIQELHLPVYHTLCQMLEEYYF